MAKTFINLAVWKYRLLQISLGMFVAITIFASGAGLVWFKSTNEGVYDRKARLVAQVQELEQRKAELEGIAEHLQDPKNLPQHLQPSSR